MAHYQCGLAMLMLRALLPTPVACSGEAPLSKALATQPKNLSLQGQPDSTSSHSAPLEQSKPLKQSLAMQAQIQDLSNVTEEDRVAAELLIGFRTAGNRCAHGIAWLKHLPQRRGDRIRQAHAQAADDITLLSCKNLCANMTSSACMELGEKQFVGMHTRQLRQPAEQTLLRINLSPLLASAHQAATAACRGNDLHANLSPLPASAHLAACRESASALRLALPPACARQLPLTEAACVLGH